jgi:CRP-like cAMP-binding protein
MDIAGGIPREELRKLFRHKRDVTLAKDAFFLLAGDVPERIGYVRSGLLRLYYIDRDGAEANKHFCLENSMAISYGAFVQREPSPFFIQALEDCRLLTIDYDTYVDLVDGHPCWQVFARKLAEMLFALKQRRESAFLLDDAKQRYLQFLEDYPGLEDRLSQYHIASYVGITPESLSRIRAGLKQ